MEVVVWAVIKDSKESYNSAHGFLAASAPLENWSLPQLVQIPTLPCFFQKLLLPPCFSNQPMCTVQVIHLVLNSTAYLNHTHPHLPHHSFYDGLLESRYTIFSSYVYLFLQPFNSIFNKISLSVQFFADLCDWDNPD